MFGSIGQAGRGMFGGLSPYSNTMLMSGLGILSGSNPQEGFQNAMYGVRAGREMDLDRSDRRKKLEDEKRRLDALHGMMQSGTGPLAGTDPATAAYLETSPDAVNSILGDRMKRKDRDIRNDSNGVPRYTDTGEAVYQSDQSESDGTAFFPGKSPIAAALNYKIKSGEMTKDEAADYAAMHFGLGPNGEMVPITPGSMTSRGQGGAGGQGQGATSLTGPRLTEDMRKASGFALRATAADKIVSDPGVASAGASVGNRVAAGVPLVGNALVPQNYQKFDQAQRDFVNAVLRRESGAAISQSEFENAQKQYFPQPFDGPEVLAQKAANRKLAIQSLEASGAPAPTFGDQTNSGGTSNTTSNGVGWTLNP